MTMYTPVKQDSITAKVLEVIRDDPGVSLCHIHDRLGKDIPSDKISNSLAFLRRTNRIQNLGKHAKGASWYPKD